MSIEEEIRKLREPLDAAPTDVHTAQRYWSGLGKVRGYDFRSGRYVIDAFAHAAMSSDLGAIAFAQAYRELADSSGEGPRKCFFSDDLLSAIRRARENASGADRELLDWVVESIELGTYD